MLVLGMFILIAFLSPAYAESCPPLCICKPVGTHGLSINCSSKWLKEVPVLPPNTIELYLRNNHLTTVPAGKFDSLINLQKVDLSNNHWNCDCNILYLKNWLEDQGNAILANITCSSPPHKKMKPINQLTWKVFAYCSNLKPIKCYDFLWRDVWLLSLALLVLILMSFAVWISKSLACCVVMNSSFTETSPTKRSKKEKLTSY
ncbi:glycoprotein IX (platelet) [Latimeria chalumnae]|uniref:glycoprotein IX (platelet) n=1 Tax=Latimeria chalumnae TaxID=7897 RepID=UPI0003C14C9C